jgi:hypothetical protein
MTMLGATDERSLTVSQTVRRIAMATIRRPLATSIAAIQPPSHAAQKMVLV